MQSLWFLNGLLVGIGITLGVVLWRLHGELSAKRKAINDELSTVLKAVVESHNTLNQSMATVDRKLSETSLRVDSLSQRRPGTVAKMPGI